MAPRLAPRRARARPAEAPTAPSLAPEALSVEIAFSEGVGAFRRQPWQTYFAPSAGLNCMSQTSARGALLIAHRSNTRPDGRGFAVCGGWPALVPARSRAPFPLFAPVPILSQQDGAVEAVGGALGGGVDEQIRRPVRRHRGQQGPIVRVAQPVGVFDAVSAPDVALDANAGIERQAGLGIGVGRGPGRAGVLWAAPMPASGPR